jgi:protein-L-isoaspartate(D-aspartate) O-methyltransferase
MFELKDTALHQGLRRRMIQMLREKGITDENVLQAMSQIPRHLYYFDGAFVEHAYNDMAFQIGCEQTISSPYTVAFQSELLDLKKREKVLEIGTGSGFQASVLEKMGGKVFTIERQKTLYTSTQKLLQNLGFRNIQMFFDDGFNGLPTYAPFDKIIITCGVGEIPQLLIQQLKVGGKMVIPFGSGDVQQMQRLTKINANEFETEHFENFKFVPMLKGKNFNT